MVIINTTEMLLKYMYRSLRYQWQQINIMAQKEKKYHYTKCTHQMDLWVVTAFQFRYY